ncbi:hypothetical protein U9M48_020773 [Paspalum notatum var. saurae]|uniref:Leucine-rich repeat-containing N-terminal plant-type domain-containing protein n=1 Tax=Paspalum notatum var. saurae TaxID=547442 RepID=A0AAQ3TFS8_PASNO
MAMRSASLVLLPLLLCASLSSISTLVAAQAGDEAALLAFKAAAVSGGGHDNLLPSWNTTSTGGFCTWEGVRCGARHRRVVALSLPSHGLTGTLSPAIGNLTFLRELNLSYNNWLHGDIPETIGRLVRLQMLDLSYNTFDGGLPANLSFCVSLLVFNLRSNRLHGRVPVELGNRLTSLQQLSLAK